MSDNNPNELTFYTDVRVSCIDEIADLPVKNDEWKPGEKWAAVEGCLIFRSDGSKVRTTLSREEVWELIDASESGEWPGDVPCKGWITVPHTIREATATANLNLI
jgi:hypothetical protein